MKILRSGLWLLITLAAQSALIPTKYDQFYLTLTPVSLEFELSSTLIFGAINHESSKSLLGLSSNLIVLPVEVIGIFKLESSKSLLGLSSNLNVFDGNDEDDELEIGIFKLESSKSLFGLSSNLTLFLNKEEEDAVSGILELEENEGLSSILKEFKLDEVSWD